MKKLTALLVLVLAAAALAACGDSGETGAGASGDDGGAAAEQSGGKLKFVVDPAGGLAYNTTEASVPAGKVTIELKNPQLEAHDIAIEDDRGKTIAQTYLLSETSGSVTANLKPGDYTFYCTVRGHRQAGMEGTLTVE